MASGAPDDQLDQIALEPKLNEVLTHCLNYEHYASQTAVCKLAVLLAQSNQQSSVGKESTGAANRRKVRAQAVCVIMPLSVSRTIPKSSCLIKRQISTDLLHRPQTGNIHLQDTSLVSERC